MQKLKAVFVLLLLPITLFAQQPLKPNAVEIYNQIEKLNFLGSVLYIAAHPDDENTRLISYMATHTKARTAYLSLTRGDGGQNLVGPELRELLGVIRTQELLEARKIDGGQQFFSRANDFGYSKNPTETLNIWDKDQVLRDVVHVLRTFQPDIIINRFDARTPGTTHGHHTASAMLSLEAFDKSNNPQYISPESPSDKTWQPKKLFYNLSWWAFGKDKFEKMDKSSFYTVNTGMYFPLLGKSNSEIAALSRSCHKSQGFGSTGTRGDELEYFELLKGNSTANKSNLFDGIDTSWNRVKGGKKIGDILAKVQANFDFKNPSASIPALFQAYNELQAVDDIHWKKIKSQELKDVIAACAGLYLEAVSNAQQTTTGSAINVAVEAINRSSFPFELTSISATNQKFTEFKPTMLTNNIGFTQKFEYSISPSAEYTEPYWLIDKGSVGMYKVTNPANIGRPDVIRNQKVTFDIKYDGITIPFSKTIIYKYNDDAKGEVYEPFDIVPDVSTRITDKVVIFSDTKTKRIEVIVTAGRDDVTGMLKISVDRDWNVSPSQLPFSIIRKGGETKLYFDITPPTSGKESDAKVIATVDGKTYDREQININYPHIPKQVVLQPSEAKFIKLDIKTGNERIGYIMGAGDVVPKSLTQMGYSVTILDPTNISKENLESYDVIITGIRAYNTVKELAYKQQILFDFVKSGKTMIVQYNTLDDFVTSSIAPFPLKISRDRVTEENAKVKILAPSLPLLNYPNKITASDFDGWKQELGLYFPSEWDNAFTPVFEANDTNETPKKGMLLIANYGKGTYIYTGLSFFRELPEGVPGAFRLMANMISQQKFRDNDK